MEKPSQMKSIDWIVVAIPLLIVLAVGIYTQRCMKSVWTVINHKNLDETALAPGLEPPPEKKIL
jgi:uncharacterized membrane protein YqhA